MVAAGVILVALAGWAASLVIPAAPAPAPGLRVNWNFVGETGALLRPAATRRDVLLPLLRISWVWRVGATLLLLFRPCATDLPGGLATRSVPGPGGRCHAR